RAARRRTAFKGTGVQALPTGWWARPRSADAAVDTVVGFFRLLGNASGNRALEMAGETLTGLLRPTLRRMIDRVPQARDRITGAQQRLITALQRRDADAARDWMGKHIRDFRRGYELAGIRPDERIENAPRR
ncbi:MAG: FCD domain-containing protein, partial [Gammaproteobacteria bacterium]|nr:FCD domain-containing protein [Gammaproteobacteria bacterium]